MNSSINIQSNPIQPAFYQKLIMIISSIWSLFIQQIKANNFLIECQQNQQLIQYFWEMDRNTEQVVKFITEALLQSVWVGAAEQIIQKKLALKAAHLQSFQFVSSYVSNATQNKQINVKMQCDKDPAPIPIDNIAYGQLQKQIQAKKCDGLRKMSVAQSVNQTRSRRFTLETSYSKKSPQKQGLGQQNDASALITLPQVKDPHYVEDSEQDNCRNQRFRNQKQDMEMKKMVQNRSKDRQESLVKNRKMIKDLKKYTYDYDGKFFSVGSTNPTHQRMIKMDKKQGDQSISNKQSKNPQQKSILNEKIKQRQTRNNKQFVKDDKNRPQFNQNRPESLIDMFEEDTKLAEGIKIVGQKGQQKIIKQKPRRKLSGMKNYRLSEYQGIVKDKKFKDFKRELYKYPSSTIDVNKTAPLPVDNNQFKSIQQNPARQSNLSSSQVSLVLGSRKNEQISSMLPPIQSSYMKGVKHLGLKRFSGAYPSSTRSILNESGRQSLKSKKSQIKIDHQQLYFQNFTTGAHLKGVN